MREKERASARWEGSRGIQAETAVGGINTPWSAARLLSTALYILYCPLPSAILPLLLCTPSITLGSAASCNGCPAGLHPAGRLRVPARRRPGRGRQHLQSLAQLDPDAPPPARALLPALTGLQPALPARGHRAASRALAVAL